MKYNANAHDDNSSGGIPVGNHIVMVTDHEIGRSSGGYEQMIVTYTDSSGRTRKDFLIFEGRADFQLASLVHCMHAEGEPAPEFDTDRPGEVKKALYGKPLVIVVHEEEYRGEMKTKVQYRNRVPAGVPIPKFGGALARPAPRPAREASGGGYGGGGGGYGGNQSDPGRDAAPPPADEDVPF